MSLLGLILAFVLATTGFQTQNQDVAWHRKASPECSIWPGNGWEGPPPTRDGR